MMTPAAKTVISVAVAVLATGLLVFGLVSILTRESYDRCEIPSLPYSIYNSQYSETFVIHWFESWPNEECDVTYILQYTIDEIPIQVSLKETSWIVTEKLEECSVLEAQLWVMTKEEVVSETFVSNTFFVNPQRASFTNVSHSLNEDGSLTVTWENPAPSPKCNVRYSVTGTTDLSTFQLETNFENVSIPYDLFCFDVFLTLSGWANDYYFAFTSEYLRLDLHTDNITLSVVPERPYELIVTWSSHLKADLCPIEYDVYYYTEETLDGPIRTSELEIRFNATFCVVAEVAIISVAPIHPVREIATLSPPPYIGAVPDLAAKSQEDNISVSWSEISSIALCNVTYLINLSTDIANFTETTTSLNMVFSEENYNYCFYFSLQIQAIVGDTVGVPEEITPLDNFIPPVDGLTIDFLETNAWEVSWTAHSREQQCGIKYEITYLDGENEIAVTIEESSYKFDEDICDIVPIAVKAISGELKSEKTFVKDDCQNLQ